MGNSPDECAASALGERQFRYRNERYYNDWYEIWTRPVKWFNNARYEKGISLMGRHREFDVEKALDAVLCVFWRKGYEGASYADLTEATGVERPALYSAFGNKEALFRQALDRYYERYLDYLPVALQLPTARAVTAHLFSNAIALNTRYPDHTGCLGINGVLAGSDEAEPIRQVLIDARAAAGLQLRERFERALHRRADLPRHELGVAVAELLGLRAAARGGLEDQQMVEDLAGPSPPARRRRGRRRN
jgi:AcrR family transcriptional regulator